MRRSVRDAGFSLIELLVVVLILGILVAIAVPKFVSARTGADETTVRSNLTAAAKVQTVAFLQTGAFVADAAGLALLEPELHWAVGDTPTGSGAVFAHVPPAAPPALYLSARSTGGWCWYVRVTPGATEYAHSTACPAAAGAGGPTYATTW